MKVLHVFKTYYPDTFGGIEEVVYQLAKHSSQFGIHAEVFALSNRAPQTLPEIYDGHRVHRIKKDIEFASTTFSLAAFQYFRKLTKEFDLIHYHFPWPVMDLMHFYANHSKPSVVTYQSDIIKQKKLLHLYKPVQQRFLNSVDAIVATTPNYVASSPVLARFTDKLTIIPNGVEPAPSTDAVKERIKYWENELSGPFFLFVGALRYYKGLDTLLQAAAKAPYPIIIAGAGFEEARLREIVRVKGLTNVRFVGAISEEDKHALLSLSFGFVFPSCTRTEAYGIVLIEASMHGKAMITCEIGTGTSYINLNGETGIVVPPNNPDAFADAMKTLWENPELSRQYGSAAKQRYEQHFTAEKMMESYVDLYNKCLQNDATSRL